MYYSYPTEARERDSILPNRKQFSPPVPKEIHDQLTPLHINHKYSAALTRFYSLEDNIFSKIGSLLLHTIFNVVNEINGLAYKMKKALVTKFVEKFEDGLSLDFAKVPKKSLDVLLAEVSGAFAPAVSLKLYASVPQEPSLGRDVASLLDRVFKGSKKLRTLRLCGLPFSSSDLEKIAQAISKSYSLKNLHLEDIDIGDDALRDLLKTVRPNQFETVVIRDCGITDDCADAIIAYATGNNSEVVTFTVEGDEFTRGQEVQDRIDEVCDHVDTLADADKARQAIEEENEKLRKRIASLRNMANALVSRDGTFVVGTRRHEFQKKLDDILRELEQIEDE